MGIEVAAEAFGGDADRGSHEHVIITGAVDPQVAAAALSRAGDRFYSVADDGRELGLEQEAAVTVRTCPTHLQ